MNQRRIANLIYLRGNRVNGYSVVTNYFASIWEIQVNNASVGHALVRALRIEAAMHPELFPADVSKRLKPATHGQRLGEES